MASFHRILVQLPARCNYGLRDKKNVKFRAQKNDQKLRKSAWGFAMHFLSTEQVKIPKKYLKAV